MDIFLIKGALLIADHFSLRPVNLKQRIEEAFTLLSADGNAIGKTITLLDELNQDVDVLLKKHNHMSY